MTKTIEIQQLDGSGRFPAYIAEPAEKAHSAIVVIQEIFGINAGIRRKWDKFAEAGYLAIAPDLFWRIEPGIELDPDIQPEFKHASELVNKLDQDQSVRDMEAAIKTARGTLGADAKVGVVGYCIGGRLAFMTATHTDVDASVGYYAVGIDNLLGEKEAISHPVMLHIGKDDHVVDAATQVRMHAGLDGNPRVTLYDYDGVGHGFATEFGKRRSGGRSHREVLRSEPEMN